MKLFCCIDILVILQVLGDVSVLYPRTHEESNSQPFIQVEPNEFQYIRMPKFRPHQHLAGEALQLGGGRSDRRLAFLGRLGSYHTDSEEGQIDLEKELLDGHCGAASVKPPLRIRRTQRCTPDFAITTPAQRFSSRYGKAPGIDLVFCQFS